jgi:hypothetical protein
MSGLPDILRIPEGPEKCSLPARDLALSDLIKFQLPPQRKSTIFANASDYLSDLSPTITTFNVLDILMLPSVVVKGLGRAILDDPEAKSIMLVHSPKHRGEDERYPLWFATIWSTLERVREERSRWCAAAEQVYKTIEKSTTSADAARRAKAALQAFEKLPWDGNGKGFKAGGTVEDLALWLTNNWLRTDNEDQMLELLAADLGLSDGSTR